MIRIDSIVYDPDLGTLVMATNMETGATVVGFDPACC